MYQLQKISDYSNCPQIQALYSDLPKKPYCTNAKGMCRIRTKRHAITHAYIQPNAPGRVQWLVFDLDDPQALFAWHDTHAPAPTIIITNPDNGHAHYMYRLVEPVGLYGRSSPKAISYLRAVQHALQTKLGADPGYSGNLVKNPAHAKWNTYITGAPQYTLGDLAEWLDLSPAPTPPSANMDFYGRNCSVFENVRHQAYAIAHAHNYDSLFRAVQALAEKENNQFDDPLQPNEINHIARSIARYCTSPRFQAHSQAWFSRLQAHRGALGGRAKAQAYQDKRDQAKALRAQCMSLSAIAKELNTHKTQVARWLQ